MERVPEQQKAIFSSFAEFFIARFGKEIQEDNGRIISVQTFMGVNKEIHADVRCEKGIVRCYFDIVDSELALKKMRVLRGSYIPSGEPLDKNLIPIMDFEEMEKRAEGILTRFYPQSMKYFMVVDPQSLAMHYGLTVLRMRIDPDSGVLGKLFFTHTRILHYEGLQVSGFQMVHPGTIVINRDPHEALPQEVERFTIAHECAHWILHRQAFLFFRAAGIAGTEEAFRRCTPASSAPKDILMDRIERQANGLAARILMPAWSTFAYANMAPAKELYTNPRYRAELAVNKVAQGLRVSKQAAKIRLMELRFEGAALAYPNLEKQDLTNEIHPKDALHLYMKSEPFRKRLSTDQYAYVQERFVYVNPKTLTRDEKGSLHLKEVDPAACLRFRYERKASYDTAGALRAYIFEPGYIAAEDMDRHVLQRRIQILQKVKKGIPEEFGDALVYYMRRRNLTEEQLAERTNVDPRTIRRYRKMHAGEPTLETVVAICVGLRLPGVLGKHLIEKAGFHLGLSAEHMAYSFILETMTANSIDECNRMLKLAGLKPLTRERSA